MTSKSRSKTKTSSRVGKKNLPKATALRIRAAVNRMIRRRRHVNRDEPLLSPTYLHSYQVAPTWIDKLPYRKTLRYRCDRLAGLTNLYFWSLTWAVHHTNGWKLGTRRTTYHLDEQLLWLLQIETVAELVAVGWVAPGIRASVQRTKQGITGSFATEKIVTTRNRRHSVKADCLSGEVLKGDKVGRVKFHGNDRLRGVTFPESIDAIPWYSIAVILRQAYVNAEKHLKAERIRWNGPPLFRGFEDAAEMLTDAKTRKIPADVLLLDLEAARRERINQLEAVIRGDVQRREIAKPSHRRRTSQTKMESRVPPAKRNPIPAAERTRPLKLREAAKLLGFVQHDCVRILSRSIKDGTVIADLRNRQSYYFRRQDFDPRFLPQIVPAPSTAGNSG